MQSSRHAGGKTASALLLALVAMLGILTARPAQAQLTLTSNGTALGFSLSTFATGFPADGNIGPLGIAFTSGGVLVADYPGNVRLFPTDTDGQNAASVPAAQNYGDHNAVGLATVGSSIYMTRRGIGDVVQINPSGTFNQVIVSNIGFATGIVADPANGHLFVSNGIITDVDPIAKTQTVFNNVNVDGLTITPDGRTLYVAGYGGGSDGHLLGFDTTSKALVFDSGFIPGGIDGTALGFGVLAGNIFANTNNGTFVEINLATKAQTLIASGGSRGDFVSVDPSNGTLLLTQSDRILRLTGGNFAPVPEASSIVSFGLMLLGGFGAFLASRKRKSRSA